MRAVLVKVGALLAPDQFRVALGDKKTEHPAHLAEEQDGKETMTATREDDHRGLREEGKEDDGDIHESRDATDRSAPVDTLSVESLSSVGGDSGVVGPEEDGEEVGERGKNGGEKWYEVMKEQVQLHKEDIGTADDADRLVHYLHCLTACLTPQLHH